LPAPLARSELRQQPVAALAATGVTALAVTAEPKRPAAAVTVAAAVDEC